ncbi:MAG: EF-P lysine aminoacylase GenX [Planctomycetaceae bacterium]|nr:EF-P lysine aminoacylase GenX [Planctomycetaceae bacterium]
MLQLRARMLDWVRRFFQERGYWEVETPLLSHDVCVDAWLEPFPVRSPETMGDRTMYLQTSPEFGMKRLLAAGADAIFQITRAFRQEEFGPLHNPEFTMVEWYRVGDTYRDQMTFVEELTSTFQTELWPIAAACKVRSPPNFADGSPPETTSEPRPFDRVTYNDAFHRALGCLAPSLSARELKQLASDRGISAPKSLGADDRDGWLNLLFVESVEPWLADQGAVFVHDYPESQAALARVRPGDPPAAERFELHLHGIEICNGYQELTDPAELQRRFALQAEVRRASGRPPLPLENRLRAAMESGLPDCAGVALGFDRLLMASLGMSSLERVLAFPFSRA